jgi:5-formyltetrahydrofolate cyclo-ligase
VPRRALRRLLLARRASLPPAARAAAERLIRAHVSRLRWLRPGAAVGLYVARGSEVATALLRRLARERGCYVFLPRIISYDLHRCVFAPDSTAPLRLSRFGIAEPTGSARRNVRALNLVLMPLVGFDNEGNRLGNGAGYYDRLLSFRRGRRGAPLLVGLAFECQRCPAIEAAAHDVPLDAVITERGLQFFRNS